MRAAIAHTEVGREKANFWSPVIFIISLCYRIDVKQCFSVRSCVEAFWCSWSLAFMWLQVDFSYEIIALSTTRPSSAYYH